MVGRKLVILGCCALLFLGSQVERAHTPSLDLPILLPNDEEVPREAVLGSIKNFRDFLTTPLELPLRFVSWSHNIETFLDMPILQKNCLSTAVYFESRSESELGQLAVAMVVMNRAHTAHSSVCRIVYKGASRFNSCQFSFACDGKPDIVDDARAWKTAIDISNMATAGSIPRLAESMQVLTIATNYHADYVNPKWSRSLTRLAKIGRHIFYSERAVETAGDRKNYI